MTTMRQETSGLGERPSLEGITINPATDRLFAAAVRRAAAASRSLVELEEHLRHRFPQVRIRSQVSDGRGLATWFVYRDGCWTTELPAHIRGRLAAVPVQADRVMTPVRASRTALTDPLVRSR